MVRPAARRGLIPAATRILELKTASPDCNQPVTLQLASKAACTAMS